MEPPDRLESPDLTDGEALTGYPEMPDSTDRRASLEHLASRVSSMSAIIYNQLQHYYTHSVLSSRIHFLQDFSKTSKKTPIVSTSNVIYVCVYINIYINVTIYIYIFICNCMIL